MPTTKEIDENRSPSKVFFTYDVDAVKVVRCRNCKYYKATTDSIGICAMVNMSSTPEGFCAWAERKEDER